MVATNLRGDPRQVPSLPYWGCFFGKWGLSVIQSKGPVVGGIMPPKDVHLLTLEPVTMLLLTAKEILKT